MRCKICGNTNNNTAYQAREMMFGSRDIFTYFECPRCGCLQINDIPNNISEYYPDDYYSFSPTATNQNKNPIKTFLKRLKDAYAIYNHGLMGRWLFNKWPNYPLLALRRLSLTKNSMILDVGCGAGALLHSLKELGFKNLLGIDLYIKENIEYKNGLQIAKKTIHELNGKWDLIMFHHSFEHLPNPLETLQAVSELLDKNGVCLLRIPIVPSYAWRRYKTSWVQLDAPRHFFLHSQESIRVLAEKAELKIKEIIYDSTEFQFWGSEQYIKNIPLTAACSYGKSPKKSIFSQQKIKLFKKQAKALNRQKQGDQAAFYLKK